MIDPMHFDRVDHDDVVKKWCVDDMPFSQLRSSIALLKSDCCTVAKGGSHLKSLATY